MPNHHITKPVLIGEVQDDGQFEVVWETDGPVVGRRLVRLSSRTRSAKLISPIGPIPGSAATANSRCSDPHCGESG